LNQRIKELVSQCLDKRLDDIHVDQEMFALLIVQECIRVLEDLRGYSGVGMDGNPYDTPSWNAALKAAEEVIIKRMKE
jgi:hypothetical protein